MHTDEGMLLNALLFASIVPEYLYRNAITRRIETRDFTMLNVPTVKLKVSIFVFIRREAEIFVFHGAIYLHRIPS